MDRTPRITPPPGAELALLAGSLLHMARYLEAGCPRAARRSELLLDRLDEAPGLPPELLSACRQLQDALWPDGAARAARPALAAGDARRGSDRGALQ